MTDLHIHTQFSADSEEHAESYLDIAMLCGEPRIGFSEHCDYDYVRRGMEVSLTDLGAMHRTLSELRSRYSGKIEILEGIEFGYAKEAVPDYERISSAYPFDYVIQSVHVPEGQTDCYFAPYFEGKSKQAAYETYFRSVLDSLRAPYPFEILGHLGYVARNAPYPDPLYRHAEYADLLDEILRAVIDRGVALEVNTNVRGAGTPFLPPLDVLRRYRELGGERVTFGSDAHRARYLFWHFDLVREALLSAGFSYACYFRRRECLFESLL